ncbi:hypothetical protein N431DRAFT_421317 [Stipitochalara longipes BDJ]|nr:hypothetical protein N431DRAFT_421317 [Stipitochalara longipes BDJ]
MPSFIESTLEVSPDSKFAYYDSGLPTPDQPYTTYIFVHGALFNHRIWKQMLDSVPPNTRVLAHSTRGYNGSSPFSNPNASEEELRALIGQDLALVIAGFVDRLSLLSHPASKIKLLTWSIGVCSLLSAYNLVAISKLPSSHSKVLTTQINEIIIFEGPSTLGFGIPASAATLAFRAVFDKLSPGEMFVAAIRQVTGIYDYSNEILKNVAKGVPTMDVAFQPRSSLADDEAFMGFIRPIMDPAPLGIYVKAKTQESEAGWEWSRIALKAMLEAPGVEEIKVLTTKHTVPDCLEGPAVLVGELTKLEGEMQVEKTKLCWVEGEHNHFVLVQAPNELWKAIRS